VGGGGGGGSLLKGLSFCGFWQNQLLRLVGIWQHCALFAFGEIMAGSGLPDGRGHGRITQNRQYKNQSGRGKLPAVKVAVSDKTIFL
jgi:hypothetical protein